MDLLPRFKNIPTQSSIVVNEFGGINTTESYKAGEMVKCKNMDSSTFPALVSRKKRKLESKCKGIINGVGTFDGVFYTFYMPETNDLYLHFKLVQSLHFPNFFTNSSNFCFFISHFLFNSSI